MDYSKTSQWVSPLRGVGMTNRLRLFALLCAVGAVTLGARQPDAPVQAEQQPRFRAGANLVRVDEIAGPTEPTRIVRLA